VVIAEPGALIGFAGPRVIEQTVRETLPEGFQRSEFLLEKGAIDMIVDRREMKDRVAALLTLLLKRPAAAVRKRRERAVAAGRSALVAALADAWLAHLESLHPRGQGGIELGLERVLAGQGRNWPSICNAR
jgi:hypothetical protein